MSPAEREGLRTMVREAIQEALRDRGGRARVAAPDAGVAETVTIESDADLAVFVRRLAALLRDPAAAARIEAGTHRFALAPHRGAAENAAPGLRLVTERVAEAAPEGATLRLAPGAVVTPLGRDRARARRIKLERTR